MRKLLVRLVLIAAVLALVGGCAGKSDDKSEVGGDFTFVSPGGQTRIFYPENERGTIRGLSGEDLLHEGKQVGIDDFKGKVVVLNIWGSWCGPCRAEADDLQAVQNELGPQGVQVLGINVRDSRSAAQDFHRDRKLTFPSIFDPSGRTLLQLKNFPRATVPATIVLDRQHRVAAIFLTEMLKDELKPQVQKILNEKG